MALHGMGAFRLIMIGKQIWLKPNNAFWTHFGGSNAAALQLLGGKWMKPSKTSQFGAFGQLCQPNQLAGMFGEVPALGMGKDVTVASHRRCRLAGRTSRAAASWTSPSPPGRSSFA